jgi:hypothetical protein
MRAGMATTAGSADGAAPPFPVFLLRPPLPGWAPAPWIARTWARTVGSSAATPGHDP